MVVGELLLLGTDRPIPYQAGSVLARLREHQDYLDLASDDLVRMQRQRLAASPRVWTEASIREDADLNTDREPRDEFFLTP